MSLAMQEFNEGTAPGAEVEPTTEELMARALKPKDLGDEAENRFHMVRAFLETLSLRMGMENSEHGDIPASAWGALTLLDEALAMQRRAAYLRAQEEHKTEELAKKLKEEKESMDPAAIAKRLESYREFQLGIDQLIEQEELAMRRDMGARRKKRKGNGSRRVAQ